MGVVCQVYSVSNVVVRWFGGLTGFVLHGRAGPARTAGGFAWWGLGGVAAGRKAILSFRLRLHSGLRQSGKGLFRVVDLGLRPRL
jgi:hypothetical protein